MFQWTAAYAVGVPAIDRDHRQWFALADCLHQAMLAGQGKRALESLLADLVAYTNEHFRREEEVMASSAYPNASEHRLQHQDLQGTVHLFQARYSRGEATMTIELMQFLWRWLQQHTTTSDRLIGDHLRRRG
jgi:hemerythrin-like metal-binding protein